MNALRFNAREVTIPWHRVGVPPVDLVDTILRVHKALAIANRRAA